jgi:ankyrin repeat protein
MSSHSLGHQLYSCAENGDIDLARRLLRVFGQKINTEVNYQDEDGWTSLMKAAYAGHISLVKFLIEADADLNSKNSVRKYSLT